MEFLDGTTVIGTAALSDGVASITVGAGVAAQVSVVYSGDADFLAASAHGSETPANEASVSLSTSVIGVGSVGSPITFTAGVTALVAGTDINDGSVEFLDGSTLLATSPIQDGAASCTTDLSLGVHQITAVFVGTDGSQATSAILPLTVYPAVPTITITATGGTYDGSAFAATATIAGVLAGVDDTPAATLEGVGLTLDYQLLGANGNLVENLGSVAPTEGGTYLVTASFAGSADYAPTVDSTVFVISQATATITVNGYSGAYDGSIHGATGSATGINGEDLSSLLNLGSTFVDAPGGTAEWSFAGNADYAPASGEVNIAISQITASINVSGFTGVYDGTAHGATATATGVGGADLSSLFYQGSTFVDVPGGTAYWYFAGNADYAPESGEVSIVITQATAKFTVTGYTGAYDGNAHGATGTATGVRGEDLSGLLTLGSTFVNVPGGTTEWSFAGNIDYAPASGEATITINPAAPILAIVGYTGTYDGNVHGASAAATGVNGENLSGDLTISAATGINAGTYEQTWTFTDPTGNYQNASGTVTDIISQAAATIVVTPYDVVYDGNSDTATGTAVGVNGENLSADLVLSGTTHAGYGSYTDTWTFTDPSGNYQDATGTVTDMIGQATITVTGYSVTYDGNPHTATGTAIGVDGADLNPADLTLAGTTHTAAGAYTDTWTFHDPTGDYEDASGTITDLIGQATITVTGYSVTYDGQAHTAIASVTGVGGVDLSSELDLSGTTQTNAGTYTYTWTFSDPSYATTSGTVTDVITQGADHDDGHRRGGHL